MKYLLSLTFILIVFASTYGQEPIAAEMIITESVPANEETQFIDGIVERKLIVENRVLPYEQVREADIPWEKKIWRAVNTREKLNWPFRYKEMPLFTIMADGGKTGEVVLFTDDDFETQLTPEALDAKLYYYDSIPVTDPETYEVTIQVTKNDINPDDIERYWVKEVWFFDKESSRVKPRILGIAPVRDVRGEFGEIKYSEPMFWVYYPQAREYFSKHRVFNAQNDAAPMTWDMLLEERMFASYIYKESNVRNQDVAQFFKVEGMDVLLESDKIKSRLFNFEHDLWEY